MESSVVHGGVNNPDVLIPLSEIFSNVTVPANDTIHQSGQAASATVAHVNPYGIVYV
jgi:hypothetical protein